MASNTTALLIALAVVAAFGLISVTGELGECPEAFCGPRVSKCMLIKSCNCSMTPQDIKNKNCTCCKDCIQCLGDLFSECCSCVGLCRPAKGIDPRLAMHSYVSMLKQDEDMLDLFDEFANAQDPEKTSSWTTHTFPTLDDPFFYKDRSNNKTDKEIQETLLKTFGNSNCTVVYMNECLSHKKCHTACLAMGASSFRWFHTGCCECVGSECLSYGSRENKCRLCQEIEQLKEPLVGGTPHGQLSGEL
uniref:Protein twisted gastrulation n=2 Tax=Plectus sambesii TaxID=2011161 RepID=A0A914WWY6_9BILA